MNILTTHRYVYYNDQQFLISIYQIKKITLNQTENINFVKDTI